MKLKIYTLAIVLTCFSMLTNMRASAKDNLTREQQLVRVMEIKQRVDQVQSMDFSRLSKTERTNLRHELKGMNKELREMKPVVIVMSMGALILIIVLVLLLI